MFDPDATRVNKCVNTFVGNIICCGVYTIVPVLGIIGGIIATPFALIISAIALPILYFQRQLINADLKWLTNKIAELNGHSQFGRLNGQDYRMEAPKKVAFKRFFNFEESESYKYEGDFIFNSVEDLTWLWHEHHRLNIEKQLANHDKKICHYWHLAIPIVGICGLVFEYFAKKSGLPIDIEPEYSSNPKGTIQDHFSALKWKLLKDEMITQRQFNRAQLSWVEWPLNSAS